MFLDTLLVQDDPSSDLMPVRSLTGSMLYSNSLHLRARTQHEINPKQLKRIAIIGVEKQIAKVFAERES